MFIQTEDTPNPQSMKFRPGRSVLPEGHRAIEVTAADKKISPLAEALFEIDGVAGVFLGTDFLTVTKKDEAKWMVLRPQLLAAVMDHFMASAPVLAPDEFLPVENEDAMDEISLQIKEIIETQIRPSLVKDGGDVSFQGFNDGIALLRLKGACAGCPSATITLKQGIERVLKHYVPELKEVRSVKT
jgi:Fe-S cluster biogenesis protein NfuA